jgi:hypothetical protein
MKNYIIVISLIMMNCNSNPNYERNLATAQKLFELHGEEDLEGQIILVSKNIKSIPPLYGSKASGYDEYIKMLKGYHEAFDNIKYTADVWLPGTDDKGNLDGSVRTYGNWKGVNVATGKELDLNGYWYFNFDENGLVSEQGDFFDAGGMIDAVYDTNNKYEIINVVNMNISKSDKEVERFSEFYQKTVNKYEPNSLGWRFFRTGKKTAVLIERYKNEDAFMSHIKNISPGGVMENDFPPLLENFSVNYMTIYGDTSDNFKNVVNGFGFKTNYGSNISGYSR